MRTSSGSEGAVERSLARAHLAETRQRGCVHGVRLRLAGGVTGRRERFGGRRDRFNAWGLGNQRFLDISGPGVGAAVGERIGARGSFYA